MFTSLVQNHSVFNLFCNKKRNPEDSKIAKKAKKTKFQELRSSFKFLEEVEMEKSKNKKKLNKLLEKEKIGNSKSFFKSKILSFQFTNGLV